MNAATGSNMNQVAKMIIPAGEFQGFSVAEANKMGGDRFLKAAVSLGRTPQAKAIRAYIKVVVAAESLHSAMSAALLASVDSPVLAIEDGDTSEPPTRALAAQRRSKSAPVIAEPVYLGKIRR